MRVLQAVGRVARRGFTLVEVLVTTVVVGVLAAVVLPAVIKQATAADPSRVASDLGSVKNGLEIFTQNVRPRMPGDVEDMLYTPSTTLTADNGLDGTAYTSTNQSKWKGPYVEWTTQENLGAGTIFKSAGSAVIENRLYRCPQAQTAGQYQLTTTADADSPCTVSTTASGNTSSAYAAIKLTGIALNSTEFSDLNTIIDGVSESSPTESGLLRQNASGTIFFLAVPYTAP